METYLRQYQLDAIQEVIQEVLLKRGFTAPITKFEETLDRRGDHYIHLTTEKFQTTPVIFKSIIVDNFSTDVRKFVHTREDGSTLDMIKVWIQVHVSYEHFGGGTNGCSLFDFSCEVVDTDDEWNGKRLYKLRIR